MTIITKHEIGDDVWFMTSNKPKKATIIGILITMGEDRKGEKYIIERVRYNLHITGETSYEGWVENTLFKTKEELIASL